MMTTKYMLGELRRPSVGTHGVICPNQLPLILNYLESLIFLAQILLYQLCSKNTN